MRSERSSTAVYHPAGPACRPPPRPLSRACGSGVHGHEHPHGRRILVLRTFPGFTAFVTATRRSSTAPRWSPSSWARSWRACLPPLEIQEVEGDAVFALGADRSLHSPTRPLLDVLEDAVAAFRTRQRELAADESCACRACRSVGSLDLEVVAITASSSGRWWVSRSQAAGVNVVLAHRLLERTRGQAGLHPADRSCAALGRRRSGGGRAASSHRALRALRRGTLLRAGSRRGRGACRGARGRVGDGVRVRRLGRQLHQLKRVAVGIREGRHPAAPLLALRLAREHDTRSARRAWTARMSSTVRWIITRQRVAAGAADAVVHPHAQPYAGPVES